MAFIIPNSTDTTGGEEFTSLDQAEPDSLDFEILGNCRTNGVVTGLGVTSNGSSTNVNVASGEVIVQGVHYTVAGNATLGLPTQPSLGDYRFDVVVARVSGGTASLAVVQGATSASNPVYPQSMSIFGGAFDNSIHIDFSTDVVLAAMLRANSVAVTSKDIVDKRVFVSSTIQKQGSGDPVGAVAAGTIYYDKSHNPTAVGEVGSGTWVYVNGSWVELAQNNSYTSGPPIGSTIWWNTPTPPSGYLIENGASVSKTTYPLLFDAIGYTFGGSGDSFNLPNTISKFVRGGTSPGNTGGANTITLTSDNIPRHRHSMTHTHSISHTHVASHSHTASSNPAGSHSHGDGSLTALSAGSHTHTANNVKNGSPANIVQNTGVGSLGYGSNTSYGALQNSTITESTSSNGAHTHTVSGTTSSAGSHSHTITVNTNTGFSTQGPSDSTSGPSSDTFTSYWGASSAASFDNRPAYLVKLPCIRYA